MYYIIVKDNEIYDKSQFKNLLEDVTNIEVTKEVFDNWERYIYRDGRIILDPDYDKKELIRRKQERIEQIKEELDELDLKSIRSIRANETDRIAQYETQAQVLRNEMHNLVQELNQ